MISTAPRLSKNGEPSWAPAVVLALAHLLLSADFTIVYVALPDMGASVGLTLQTAQSVVHAYSVLFGGFLLLGGRVADLLGGRRALLIGLALFGAASACGAVATSAELLILARAVQGCAAALIFPSTLAVLHALYSAPPTRTTALALWSVAGPTGLALGSVFGGVLVSLWEWPSVFWGAAVVALLLLAFAARSLRPNPSPVAGRLGGTGAATITASISLLVYVLVQLAEPDRLTMNLGLTLLAALVLGVAFVRIERRAASPLVPPHLLRNAMLRRAMTSLALFMGAFMSLSFAQTMLFQEGMGLSPLETGFAFLVPCVAQASGTAIGARLARHFSMRALLTWGFMVAAAGAWALAAGLGEQARYLVLVPGLVIGSVGQGVAFGPMWSAVTVQVPSADHGVASAMASTAFQIGGAVGMAAVLAVARALMNFSDARADFADAGALRIVLLASGSLFALGGFMGLGFPATMGGGAAAPAPR